MLTLTASGVVSDYSDTSSLQQGIATAAGVHKSLVTINVAAASVIITAAIAVPAATPAATVLTSLTATVGTPAAASAAFGITVESVTIGTASSPACSKNYAPICPSQWGALDRENHSCKAPTEYSGQCNHISWFNGYSDEQKEQWSLFCQADWPCLA